MSDAWTFPSASRDEVHHEPRREFRRWNVDLPRLVIAKSRSIECNVQDLSPGGASVQFDREDAIDVGGELILDLDADWALPSEVRFFKAHRMGLMFLFDEDERTAFARYLVEMKPERSSERRGVRISAQLRGAGVVLSCVVENLSADGANILIDAAQFLNTGDEVYLVQPGYTPVPASVSRVDGQTIGIHFLSTPPWQSPRSG